jgi:class 3 adenylate cyclase
MRLGTKILILTLAITLTLAGIIVWVVTRDLTARETARARADIRRAVTGYFERIDALHHSLSGLVSIVTGEPTNRAQLDALDSGGAAPREQYKYLLDEVVQRELRDRVGAEASAFHVILNFEGRLLLAFAPDDGPLTAALAGGPPVEWPYEPLLADEPRQTRKYVLVGGGLYLVLGVPLRLEAEGPPSHAYFAGYRIDDRWATALLGDAADTDGEADAAAGGAAAHARGPTPPQASFLVDGRVVARSANAGGGAAGSAGSGGGALASVTAGLPPDLQRRIEFETDAGEHFVGEAVAFDLPGGRRGALAVASSLTAALAPLRHLQATIAWVTAGVAVVAVVAFRFVSNLIARPVGQLVAGTQRVARGEFDRPIRVDRRDELGQLARSFNDMADGLRQRDLVKSTFGRFVDPRIVEGFLADPTRLMPGGDKRVQTVLFSDLVSFTGIAERLDADDLVALLNGYLGDAADAVTEQRGIVDKFIGDAVVAFWGPPITDDHAALACRAALRMVASTRRHDGRCRALGVPPLAVRVGVATGEVLVGIIGSSNKFAYTVMGDTANLGSRLEGLNKLYHTNVLVTARTAREAAAAVVTRPIDRVRVVGRAEPIELHEVLAERGEENGVISGRCEAYAEALVHYARRDWTGAHAAFQRIIHEWPDDGASRAMAERCAAFQREDPGPKWDGVWIATSK